MENAFTPARSIPISINTRLDTVGDTAVHLTIPNTGATRSTRSTRFGIRKEEKALFGICLSAGEGPTCQGGDARPLHLLLR